MKSKPVSFSDYDKLACENAELLEMQNTNLARINDLEHMLENFKRVLFGSKSEKTSAPKNEDQLSLFKNELDGKLEGLIKAAGVVCNTNGSEDKAKAPNDEDSSNKVEEKKTKKQRRTNHIELEERETILEVPEDLKYDALGNKLHIIGYETTTSLEYVAAKMIKHTVKRPIMGDKETRERCSVVAYNRIVPKGRLGDSLIHKIIYDKFAMALPLERQLKELHRLGVDLSSSLLSDTVKNFGNFYTNIYHAMQKEVLTSLFVHADESPLKYVITVQDPVTKKITKTYKNGVFWVFSNAEVCFYHFGGTRDFAELESIFEQVKKRGKPPDGLPLGASEFVDYLMTDGAPVYNKIGELDLDIINMACWVHGRRNFEKILDNGKHQGAQLIYDKINELYTVERWVTEQIETNALTPEDGIKLRTKTRGDVSRKIIAGIWELADTLLPAAQKSSPFEKAIKYILNRKEQYEVFLSNGALPLDNNEAENGIRGMVIGRKNYMFTGSEAMGLCAAKAYSLVESCFNVKINFLCYLDYTTKAILGGRTDYENLTPKSLAGIVTKDLAL